MFDVAAAPPPPEVLRRAAEMRANGNSWEFVGRKLGVDADAARAWADADPVAWRQAVAHARTEITRDGIAEATVAFRQQLRSDDDRTVRDAAGWFYRLWMTMLRHRKKNAKPAPAAGSDAKPGPPDPFDEFGVSTWEDYDAAVVEQCRGVVAKYDKRVAKTNAAKDDGDD